MPPRAGAEEEDSAPVDDVPTSSEGALLWKVKQIDETSAHWAWRFPLANLNKEERKQHFSRELPLADHSWRVMVMDRHYIQPHQGGHGQCWISIYVDLVEAHTFQHNQQLQAHFAIILVNKDPEKNNRKESNHSFTCSEYDRGFAQFVTIDDIFNPAKGWIHTSFDGSECLLIEVQVKDGSRPTSSPANILKCPREHGFSVGLKNQGATCYLNSLMQTLYHLSYFRNSVYALPTEDSESGSPTGTGASPTQPPKRSITLALQRLFCKMQLSDEPIETKELTESFGWNKEQAFQQHDIQELMRLLSDYLEKKMKGTESEGMFNKLFEGKMRAYVKCCNVPYESSRDEAFYEVHVCVRDCANIYESMDKEVLPERLDGDNKYDAESHGKQPADKGTEFKKFPPVLFIHLKRFEFNFATEMQIKVNSRYEFYDEISMKPGIMLTPDGQGSRHCLDPDDTENNYLLFAVMVHAGSAYGGHYYAFLKSISKEGKTVWLKYDDERVSIVKEQQAISDNFGGRDPNKWWEKERGESIRSAYMLVYIKKSEWSKYCFPLGEQDMPAHVRDALISEQKEEQKRRKEKEEQHRYFHFKIVTEADFKRYDKQEPHHDLYKFDAHPITKVEREMRWQDFKEHVSELTGCSAQCLRLWQWNKRNNKTNRPDTVVDKNRWNSSAIKPDMPLDEIFFQQQRGAHFLDMDLEPIELFVEQSQDSLPVMEADSALLLLKHYDPVEETLRYIGHYICKSKSEKLLVTKDHLNDLLGRPQDAELDVYEEIRKSMIERRDWSKSIKDQELDHGDILIVQVPPAEIVTNTPLQRPNATDYFTYLNDQLIVRFYEKKDPTKESCKISLLKGMDFGTVCDYLAREVQVKATHIRLWPMSVDRDGPSSKPLRMEERASLQYMTNGQKERDKKERVLYWEELSIPLEEMEQKIPLKIVPFSPAVVPQNEVELLCDKNDTVDDVLQKLQESKQVPEGAIHMLKVMQCRIDSILPGATKISELQTTHVRVEAPPVHPDTLCTDEDIEWGDTEKWPRVWATQKKDNSRLVQVQHIAPDTMNTPHSHPFLFWVLDNETADQCKERLRLKLKQTEDTFKRWTLALHAGSYQAPTKFQGNEDILSMLKDADVGQVGDQAESRLALIHKDPHKKSLYAGQALSLNVNS